ncbi:hypothetical protein GCM10017083_31100 [Thalassobaculum fulvum]|uniref:Uncharacterized protein n=2 Tax=Thalassobaculum fulvum TaxID=1633335 RepID=A0A919CQR9_9PROT|nr:hypothetical protein GCM10017083_31100 [Thalassobaculum fulvum]
MNRTLVGAVRGAMWGAVALLLMPAAPVHAQMACAAREAVVSALATRFGETVSATGVDRNGNLLEVFSSAGGSWTIVLTIPGGPTCLLASGDGWWQADERRKPAGTHDS